LYNKSSRYLEGIFRDTLGFCYALPSAAKALDGFETPIPLTFHPVPFHGY